MLPEAPLSRLNHGSTVHCLRASGSNSGMPRHHIACAFPHGPLAGRDVEGTALKSSRRSFTLLLSLLLASGAAIAVYVIAASQQSPTSTAATAPPTPTSVPTAAVLVAKLDIAAATTLTEDMLEVKQVPVELRHARALTEPGQALGKMTAVSLVQGEQILDMRLSDTPQIPTDTFAVRVPVGMRAMSIVFDEVIGSGALVQPGDYVDVLAYFELEVDDFTINENDEDDGDKSSEDDEEGDKDGSKKDEFDYKQYVTTYVVQNVQVLAVSQALTPSETGIEGQTSAPTPTPAASATAAADEESQPVARPAAKSVTLAVTPEQAQRLLLAAQTVKNEKGSLRLAMRAPGDTTTIDVGPAQLGNIPLDDLLGDVDQPMVPTDLVIVSAAFRERILPSGGVLEFTATVKNVSDRTIKSSDEAPPEYVYTQGIAYDTLGFFPEKNTYRIGLNVSGAYPTQFPYRWGLGRDLEPGESIDVVGSVRLTQPTAGTRYWLGIIQEPSIVTQDGVSVADITVIQTEAATVSPETVFMRAEPDDDAEIVLELLRGDEVAVVQVRGPWFQVRFGQKEGWIRVEALNVPPLGD